MDFHLFIIFLIFLIGSFFLTFTGCDSLLVRKAYLFISLITLILESGLRGMSVGDDTLNYNDIFYSVKYSSWNDIINGLNVFSERSYNERDPGFDFFQKIFQLFSDDYRIFLLFIAICFFSSLYFFLLRNTFSLIELILGLLIYSTLFYHFFSITGIRQCITTAIALYCSKYIFQKKLLKFVIPIIVASLIHSSVLIFLPFYFQSRFKNIKANYIFALLMFVVIFIFKQNLVLFLLSGSVYEIYLDNLDGPGTYVFTTLLLLMVLISYFLIDRMKMKYPEYAIYYNAILIALILVPLTWVNANAMRVVQYYSIYMILFIPKIIGQMVVTKTFYKRLVFAICIVLLLIYNLNLPSRYKFYWDESGIYQER